MIVSLCNCISLLLQREVAFMGTGKFRPNSPCISCWVQGWLWIGCSYCCNWNFQSPEKQLCWSTWYPESHNWKNYSRRWKLQRLEDIVHANKQSTLHYLFASWSTVLGKPCCKQQGNSDSNLEQMLRGLGVSTCIEVYCSCYHHFHLLLLTLLILSFSVTEEMTSAFFTKLSVFSDDLCRWADKFCLSCNIFIYIQHIWIKLVLCSRMVSLFHHTSPWTHRCLQFSPSARQNGRVFRHSVQQHAVIEFLTAEKVPPIEIHRQMQAVYGD